MIAELNDPSRFRLLANCLACRAIEVRTAREGQRPYTDGKAVYVSAGATPDDRRREVVLQALLLGGGSLEPTIVRRLRSHPKIARRYLALEGQRVLAESMGRVPIAATFGITGRQTTGSAAESLAVACGRRRVSDPPDWFGVIHPWRLLHAPAAARSAVPTDAELQSVVKLSQSEDDDEVPGEDSKILKLFQNPLFASSSLTKLLASILGASRAPGRSGDGPELSSGSIRSTDTASPSARVLPVPLPVAVSEVSGGAHGSGGVLYPEWDVHNNRYRPQWCRAIEIALPPLSDIPVEGAEHDEVLYRRLARVGLGPKVLRGRPDGEDLDVDALIELAVNVRSGHSAGEGIYLERRKLARNLGVLILLDASGSATDTDPRGLSVHEHQRRAAATLAVTLERLGDRVAIYGFRSSGRDAVHLLALKPFSQRFGAGGRARLNQLEPAGYTRLGAAIRHAGALLKSRAGTPNLLLVVISDGFPYDHGYESNYAEADARKALEEVRTQGMACLCLSIGASTPTDALHRVFGSASHANASTLAELSPRMDELFVGALQELSVGQPRQSAAASARRTRAQPRFR